MNTLTTHSETELQVLAELAEAQDLQARTEQRQIQAQRMADQLSASEAQARYDAKRREYPHATPDQICRLLDQEPRQYVSAAHVIHTQSTRAENFYA
jgi:hypothetical protein